MVAEKTCRTIGIEHKESSSDSTIHPRNGTENIWKHFNTGNCYSRGKHPKYVYKVPQTSKFPKHLNIPNTIHSPNKTSLPQTKNLPWPSISLFFVFQNNIQPPRFKESVKVDLPWSTCAMTLMERMLSVLSMIVRIWSTVKFGMAAFGTDPGAIGNGGWRVFPVDFSPSKIRPLELLRQRRWWDICWAEQELPCWDFLQQHQKGFLFNPIYIFHSWWWHLDVSCRFETNSSVATDLKYFLTNHHLFCSKPCLRATNVLCQIMWCYMASEIFWPPEALSEVAQPTTVIEGSNYQDNVWCHHWKHKRINAIFDSLHGSDILKQNTLSEAVPLRSGEVELRHSCQPQLI